MSQNRRIRSFDGLRGLAAVVVMIFHVITWTRVGSAANYSFRFVNDFWRLMTVTPLKLLWSGNEAVILFYMIGGFVVAKPFIEGRKLDFFGFFQKRFLRLVVPYWVVLLVTVGFIFLFQDLKQELFLSGGFNVKWESLPELQEVLGQMILVETNMDVTAGAFWSIVQEWRISLLMPFIGVLLYRYPTWKVAGGILALNRLLAFALVSVPTLHRTNYYFLYFFAGALLCKHLDEVRAWFHERRWLVWFVPVLIPFQWVLAGFGVELGRRATLLVSAIGMTIVLLAVIDSARLKWFFESKPLQFLGKISFSLYLTHTTFIVLFTTLLGQIISPQWALLVSPVFAIGFAKIWYERVEQGMLNRISLKAKGKNSVQLQTLALKSEGKTGK